MDDVLIRILRQCVRMVSGPLRAEIIKAIYALDALARGTENSFDDLLVEILKAVFEVD